MKKNLTLFGILVALIGFVYLFQEKKAEREYVESETRDQLIREEITHLKLPGIEAEKIQGAWYQGKNLLSHNTFKQIETKLHDLKKVKDIEGEWKNYFLHPMSIEINHVTWTIGDMAVGKQTFYIAREKKIMLAQIEGESTHLTQDETEIPSIKLNELVSLISKPAGELKENQLFRYYHDLPSDRVVISADGSLPFELDFVHNKTLPPPIPGISVLSDLKSKFFSLLTQMTIKEEIPFSPKLLFKKMGTLQFLTDSKKVSWELWLKNEKSADALIIDPDQKRAYLMSGATLKVFFIQLQDYWDKKVIPPENFKSFTRLATTFIEGAKSVEVAILNREPLAFEVPGHKVHQQKMEALMQFLFNLGPLDQAQRVSLLSTTEKKQYLSETHLRLTLMDQELIVLRKTQELIVVNLTQGFKAHFHLLDENFRGNLSDVIE